MKKVNVAQIKILPKKGDLKYNFEMLKLALDELSEQRVDVVVTPECFLDGYISTEPDVKREDILSYAIDPSQNEMLKYIQSWSLQHKSWFIFGCTRVVEEGVSNTALVINREGEWVGSYDKVHCQLHDKKYVRGDALKVFDSDFGTFGVMICADRRWPETVRTLALKGANVIFNPTYGLYNDMNLALMRTRSFESEVFITFTHPEQALVTGPKGDVLKNAQGDHRKAILTELNLEEVVEVRDGGLAMLKQRRPSVYQLS